MGNCTVRFVVSGFKAHRLASDAPLSESGKRGRFETICGRSIEGTEEAKVFADEVCRKCSRRARRAGISMGRLAA